MYKYELEIKGMMCSMCEAHINDVVRRNFDVKKLKSNHKKNLTTFIANEIIDENLLKEVISKTGYEVTKIKYE